MNKEELEKKADLLAEEHKVSKVHIIVQKDGEKEIISFLKEPNYLTKLRIMDKIGTSGLFSAADEMRQVCTIKDASDPISYGDGSECDRYKLGIVNYCLTILEAADNEFKKK